MIKVGEWVAQVVSRRAHRSCNVSKIRVLHDGAVRVLVAVKARIVLLILAEAICESGVGLQNTLLLAQVVRHVLLHLLEERIRLFDVDTEFSQLHVQEVAVLVGQT